MTFRPPTQSKALAVGHSESEATGLGPAETRRPRRSTGDGRNRAAPRSRRSAENEQSMQRLQGIAVSPGVAIGEALVMDSEGFRIPRRFVARDAVIDELDRLDKAVVAAGGEIEAHRDAIARELGAQPAAIFDAHLQMLRDPKLRGEL
jgi:signal transduction protein with GAF and PtsI domain